MRHFGCGGKLVAPNLSSMRGMPLRWLRGGPRLWKLAPVEAEQDHFICGYAFSALGAVGSHFAVRLALAGHEVACVMRGPHLEAVKAKGLTLRAGGEEFNVTVNASDDPAALGPQDVVLSTLKATALASLVTGLPPLLREDTAVVFAQNGIPWWYDLGLPAIIRRRPISAFSIPVENYAPPSRCGESSAA